MITLQIAGNTVSLNEKEKDALFQLLDNNYEFVQHIPTLNALHNWMKELGCRGQVAKKKETIAEDPWSEKESLDPQEKLRKMLGDLLQSGYYIAS